MQNGCRHSIQPCMLTVLPPPHHPSMLQPCPAPTHRVPDLQLDLLAIDGDHACAKLHPACRGMNVQLQRCCSLLHAGSQPRSQQPGEAVAAKRASACAPDGQVVYRLEALVCELQQQARLSHARVACGKVAAVGAMGDVAQGWSPRRYTGWGNGDAYQRRHRLGAQPAPAASQGRCHPAIAQWASPMMMYLHGHAAGAGHKGGGTTGRRARPLLLITRCLVQASPAGSLEQVCVTHASACSVVGSKGRCSGWLARVVWSKGKAAAAVGGSGQRQAQSDCTAAQAPSPKGAAGLHGPEGSREAGRRPPGLLEAGSASVAHWCAA